MSRVDIVTPSTKHMSPEERQDGIDQMIADLTKLAEVDGCIAAAWALEVVDALTNAQVAIRALAGSLQTNMDYLKRHHPEIYGFLTRDREATHGRPD
jgi:hypothetical protein